MASTRELVQYILEQDPKMRNWFDTKHGFTVEKAKTADLTLYEDLLSAIVTDGLRQGIINQGQMSGSNQIK